MVRTAISFLFLLLWAAPALAMTADGCGAGSCNDCHFLEKEEAGELLSDLVDRVNNVEFSEVPGLWVVEAEKNNIKIPVYLDFSKSFVIAGDIVRLGDKTNITRQQFRKLNPVDVESIPLEDALLLGDKDAALKTIVFTDPECPYCKELHHELKDVVRKRPDMAFYLKLFPLPIHPNAYKISQSIVCEKSMTYLEDSFNKKPVPAPTCETDAIDANIALAKKLGIRSTPTLILPDGRIAPGMKESKDLIPLIESAGTSR